MRFFYSLIFLCFTTLCFSQVPERQILKGKINVPIDSDASNISVYNLNTEEGTNTNSYGEFLIKVKTTDHLLISSVQFEKFEIEITKEIMEERDIVINIRENVNQLNPVTISSNVLSGDLNVDVKKINVNETKYFKANSKILLNSVTNYVQFLQ
jgi:predicted nucleic acid-binding protein